MWQDLAVQSDLHKISGKLNVHYTISYNEYNYFYYLKELELLIFEYWVYNILSRAIIIFCYRLRTAAAPAASKSIVPN
jgi:hypothetical protein